MTLAVTVIGQEWNTTLVHRIEIAAARPAEGWPRFRARVETPFGEIVVDADPEADLPPVLDPFLVVCLAHRARVPAPIACTGPRRSLSVALLMDGADVVGAIVGVTAGGLTGAQKTLDLAAATDVVRAICAAAKAVRPDVMVIAHGGPFKDPETAAYAIAHSEAVGYAAAMPRSAWASLQGALLERDTGFRAGISLEDGLDRTVEAIRRAGGLVHAAGR